MSATITGFSGADCTGTQGESFNVIVGECFSLGGQSTKSFQYTDVPTQSQYYASGGQHDSCTGTPSSIMPGGTGCATAPNGLNWESVSVF
ncbi:hypothetical protein JR316_0009421 [Psilocybe cubensis]|uniref:Uncharacterized protein n=1 Tax=Psilocybe cubensis TaxID=181762 RepID=A0ACB8GTJ1_PSICU|nr:hypothetical protein JR316_0009421 [Psilocybe cubensis]KAH9478958.1 hypothetical protein JR316_0009421 [Psilocybe cubensis]